MMRPSAVAVSTLSLIWLSLLGGARLTIVAGTASELGTQDGYDVGGVRPICYETNIAKDPNEPDTDGSNYTAIEILNEGMFGEKKKEHDDNEYDVSLLPTVRENLPSSDSATTLYFNKING